METIKIRMRDIKNPAVSTAIRNLNNQSVNGKFAYKLHKLSTNLTKAIKHFDAKYTEYQDKYAEKNEDGTMKIIEDENGVKHFNIPDDKAKEAQEYLNALLDDQYDLEVMKLDASELSKVDVKASELFVLENFFTDFSVLAE